MLEMEVYDIHEQWKMQLFELVVVLELCNRVKELETILQSLGRDLRIG